MYQIGDHGVVGGRNPVLLTQAHDGAVEEVNFRFPLIPHVLGGRGYVVIHGVVLRPILCGGSNLTKAGHALALRHRQDLLQQGEFDLNALGAVGEAPQGQAGDRAAGVSGAVGGHFIPDLLVDFRAGHGEGIQAAPRQQLRYSTDTFGGLLLNHRAAGEHCPVTLEYLHLSGTGHTCAQLDNRGVNLALIHIFG